MSKRLLVGLVGLGILILAVPLILLSHGGQDPVLERMDGDVAEVLERADVEDLPLQAEALLATDRPWRAARLMRRYLAETPGAPIDRRLLAARAEAGWGGWDAVHSLLDGAPALDAHEGGIGLYLLGRSRDARGDTRGAIEAYRAFLAHSTPAAGLEAERAAARLRLGLALVRTGSSDAARQELTLSRERAGTAAVWIGILEADALAQVGDTAGVRRAVAEYDSGILGLRAWRARIAAARHAGDVPAARALANQARAWARTDGTRAEFLVAAARAALDMGDATAGRAALRSAIDRSPAGAHAREAAALLQDGVMTPADHLAVARVYRAQGLHKESIDGYRRWLAARGGTSAERAAVHLEHANALFYAQKYDEVDAALRPIASQRAARMLKARNESHRGEVDAATRTYLALAEEAAGAGPAVQALFLAAGVRHDHGQPDRAAEIYRRVVARYPGTSQMGLATMRLAGIAFLDGDYREAARRWDDYRARYPRGTLWTQATYWSGRAHAELGDEATARGRFRAVLERDRDSYYALRASERLDQPFWPLPMSPSPPVTEAAAATVARWMAGIDLLRAAGFEDEASAQADRVAATVGADRATRYALAEALAERGYAQRAIRIGLALRGSGEPNPRLLRILYPFPYRTLITEEARDRGLDPFIAAALIRQESMFEARITSHVGARGLMQIMPATGRGLAEAVGMDPWDPELLYHPEINVHLGIRYLTRHMDTYDGSLPAVFSAYNAGFHRVDWWKEFPEYDDDQLFTERIPFRETRDYVKILTRNLALYRGLYGDGSGAD
jgi:soluble lytic murein transglycosylase